MPVMRAVRDAVLADEDFLWLALTHAASMPEPGPGAIAGAQADPYLRTFVAGWGAPGDLGVIAEHDGAATGAAWIRRDAGRTATTVRAPDIAELAIATVPGDRGGGAGTAMMARLLARARGVYPAIELSVRDGNPAVRLYQRLGFETIRTVTNRVGGVSFVMRIALEPPS